jgi:hypothetical protein
VAKYPKIFKCSCGRNLRRDDKKNIIYFGCTKVLTPKYDKWCEQKYIQLKRLEPSIEKIVNDIIPTSDERKMIINYIDEKLTSARLDK